MQFTLIPLERFSLLVIHYIVPANAINAERSITHFQQLSVVKYFLFMIYFVVMTQ